MKEVLTEASADPGADFFRFARDRETTYHLRESAYRASLSPRSDAAPINVRNQIPVAHSFATSAAVGKVKWKVAPRPELALAHKRPPCDSTIERLIESPIPVPSGFVVKNASKILLAWSEGSPAPLSLTEISS